MPQRALAAIQQRASQVIEGALAGLLFTAVAFQSRLDVVRPPRTDVVALTARTLEWALFPPQCAERGGARSGQAPLRGGPLRRARSQPPRAFVGRAETGAAWTNAGERSHPSLAWASVTAGAGAAHGASSALPRAALVPSRLWTDRVSACRSPGRRTARPSGETTGRWDVHQYGTDARLATVASRSASPPTSPAARRPSGRATRSCCPSPRRRASSSSTSRR